MNIFKIFLGLILSFCYTLSIADSEAEDKNFWLTIKVYGQAKTEAERDKIGKKIWSTYGKENAVIVIDTSGFTLRSIDEGIISTLVVIQELRDTVSKVMHETHGAIIKFDADNAFLRFDTPQEALDTALKINQAWANSTVNEGHKHPIKLSMGIDYGPILMLSQDAFSKVLNVASKLGEDTAEANEILMTKRAYQGLKQPVAAVEKTVEISHVNIIYYNIKKVK